MGLFSVPLFSQRQIFSGDIAENTFCYMCNVPRNHTFFNECVTPSNFVTPLSYILDLDLVVDEDTANVDDGSDNFIGGTGHSKSCNEHEIGDPVFVSTESISRSSSIFFLQRKSLYARSL